MTIQEQVRATYIRVLFMLDLMLLVCVIMEAIR